MYIGGKYITNGMDDGTGGRDLERAEEGYPNNKRRGPQEPAAVSSLGEMVSNDHSDEEESMSDYDELGDSSGSMSDLRSRAAKETRKSLVRKETKAVSCLRYFVLFVLLGTAIGVSLATFYYSRGVEKDTFDAEFASVAVVTLRSFVEAVEHKLGAMDAMATGVTSHAIRTGEVFPNVTVPDYEIKGATVRTQTDSIYMFYLPLVTDETRAGYEMYTAMNQGQIFQSYVVDEGMRQYQDMYFGINASETEAAKARAAEAEAAEAAAAAEAEAATANAEANAEAEVDSQGRQLGVTNTPKPVLNVGRRKLHVAGPDVHPTIHDGIWGLKGADPAQDIWGAPPNTGPYLPMWQLSPTIPFPGLINFNFLDYFDIEPMLSQSVETGKAVLSYLQTNLVGSDTEDLIRAFLALNQYRHVVVDYNADPMTQVAYPVFDGFNPLTKNVTGLILTTIFWRLLFLDTLPENVKGVVCVLSNSLNETVTYQIDGKEVVYLGEGDLHDEKYNDMVVTRDLSEYLLERANVQSSSYTTIELDVGYTSYFINVYPSELMESTYITSDPILYSIIVAFIFVFTSMVFILYDRCVEKRQKKVMGVAIRSTAVVTSLFPKVVQDRLFGENKDETSAHEQDPWLAQNGQGGAAGNNYRRGSVFTPDSAAAPLPTLDEYAEGGDSLNGASGHMSSASGGLMDRSVVDPLQPRKKKKDRAIADKYAATTVYFADLAGFTKWSSTREPEQVFELLETLYGAFDKVALRRQVFKVETIGDCYMAVTGLPNPQPDHAIRMVKFARDCMVRMDRLLDDLQHSLGADTLDLAMRVGLHSGPVTAGVLRGDKGRFQLFGDTVNTASRMESNGVKGRIHCSGTTAELLPEKWLTAREDKVFAKGKGEMQTYYVDVNMGARSALSAYEGERGHPENFEETHPIPFNLKPDDHSFVSSYGSLNQAEDEMHGISGEETIEDIDGEISFGDEGDDEPEAANSQQTEDEEKKDEFLNEPKDSFESDEKEEPARDSKDVFMNEDKSDGSLSEREEVFMNEVKVEGNPQERSQSSAQPLKQASQSKFTKFGQSIAKVLALNDEISV